jgi:xanthine dehydrogenase accessory factor
MAAARVSWFRGGLEAFAMTPNGLKAFLDRHEKTALVEVAEAKGSTPREKGAWMLVSPTAIFGTIGGGQLEFMAIDRARALLERRADGGGAESLTVPLGPAIGQCCGGKVELSIRPVGEKLAAQLAQALEAEAARLPRVYVFGGGHVGHALAAALAPLPVRAVVVETRAEALEDMPRGIATKLTPVPEEMVAEAPHGSAFVVLTHEHSLDFLIVAAALQRQDASYVGMIGSETKKATFRNWYLKTAGGSEAAFARLVSPIGGADLEDKRPAVIAALAAAEILRALAGAR